MANVRQTDSSNSNIVKEDSFLPGAIIPTSLEKNAEENLLDYNTKTGYSAMESEASLGSPVVWIPLGRILLIVFVLVYSKYRKKKGE